MVTGGYGLVAPRLPNSGLCCYTSVPAVVPAWPCVATACAAVGVALPCVAAAAIGGAQHSPLLGKHLVLKM